MKKTLSLVCLLLALGATGLITLRFMEREPPEMPVAIGQNESPGLEPKPSAEPEPSMQAAVEPVPAGASGSSTRREVPDADAGEHFLDGRVVDETGGGVAVFSLEVEFKPKGVGAEWEPYEWGPFAGGVFQVDGLREGRWRMWATAQDHTKSKRKTLRTPYTKDEIVLELKRQAKLGGRVLGPDGKPHTGAWVSVRNAEAGDKYESDEDGRFEGLLLPGRYECIAKDGTFGASEIVYGNVEFGREAEVELQLRRGGRIEGEALDEQGLPLKGYFISLHSSEWHLDKRTINADDLGQFAFPHVAPGAYWLEAAEEEGNRSKAIREAAVALDGETTRVLLGGLNPDAVIVRGTVYLAGEIQPEAPVWGTLKGSEAFASGASARANELGEFEIEFPGSGPAQLMVAPKRNQIIPIPILLTEEREQRFDIHVPAGRISGRVLGVANGELSPPFLTCRPEGLNPITSIYMARTTKADERGEFVFDFLPAGSYRVAVRGIHDPRAVVEEIELELDGEVAGLQLVGGGEGTVEVLVLDESGQPVPGAKVYAQDSAGHLYVPTLGTETGVDGIRSYKGLGQGEFRFFAQVDETDQVTPLSGPVLVDPETPSRVEVQLTAGALATIEVLDGDDPISARLWVWDGDGNEYSRTLETFDHARYLVEGDKTGHYPLGPLAAGTYMVRAKASDGRSAEGELVLIAGRPVSLTLQLKP